MKLTDMQQETIFWLVDEYSIAVAEGCRDAHLGDVEGIRSLLPLLTPEQAAKIEDNLK